MKKYLLTFILSATGIGLAHAADPVKGIVCSYAGQEAFFPLSDSPNVKYETKDDVQHAVIYVGGVEKLSVALVNGGTLTVTYDTRTLHEHSYASAWTTDETHHWHVCTGNGECDAPKSDEAAHSYGEVATETSYYTCSVCQYQNTTRKAEYEVAQEEAKYATLTYNIAGQSGLGVMVKKGEVSLSITAEECWTVATLTVNAEDKLADLTEGKLTFNMQDDATVAVSYKWADEANLYTESDVTTGIITTKAGVKAYVKNGQICAESNGAAISIYTLSGAKIAQKAPSMNTAIFAVPAGTYIVKVGKEGIKLEVE